MHIPLQTICDIYFKLIRNICYRPSLTWATFEHALNKHIVVWAWWLPFFSLTFSYKLSLENVFWLVCHWRLLLRIQLTMNQHWFEVMAQHWIVDTLRLRQNGRHFTDDTFKRISVNENVRISIKFSLKFILKCPINNIPALVLIMAWRRPGDKPLSEPVMVSLLTHICVTRPRWVNKSLPGSLMIHSSHYQNHWWSTQVITRIIDDPLQWLLTHWSYVFLALTHQSGLIELIMCIFLVEFPSPVTCCLSYIMVREARLGWPQFIHNLEHMINSLVPGRPGCHFETVIFNLVLLIGFFISSNDNAQRWMPWDITDDKSALVQVMAWCRQAPSHYLSQCWPSSLSPYGVTRPQWVNSWYVLKPSESILLVDRLASVDLAPR